MLFVLISGVLSLGNPALAFADAAPPNGMGTNDTAYTPSPALLGYMKDKAAVAQKYRGYHAGTDTFNAYVSALQAFQQRYHLDSIASSGVVQSQKTIQPYANSYSRTLSVQQYPQSTYYYCGPASAQEILNYLGVTTGPDYPYEYLTQQNLATSSNLKTDQNGGTNWGSNVFAPTLNRWKGTTWYVQNQVYNPGMSSESQYESNMSFDIDNGWPIAAGIDEKNNNSIKLTGHPYNWQNGGDIQHWIAITGYSSYGGWTQYVDSIHGTHFWSWSSNVPASSSVSSNGTIWPLMVNGNYGMIW